MDINRVTGEKMIKLLIKVSDGEANKWIHLCYVPEIIYEPYKDRFAENLKNFNSTLAHWAEKDFNKKFTLTTSAELEELKNLIKGFCKETYPDVYLEQATDRQGWLRVWITKKMKEELSINGE